MKILFLTPWYPDEKNPNHGVFVRDQVVALGKKFQVRVVSSKIDYSVFALSSLKREDSEYNDIRESRIVIKQSLPVFNQFNFFIRTISQTWKIAKEFKPDIIHGNIGYPGAFWSWIMSKILNVPFIISEHTRITNNFRSSIHRFFTLFSLKRTSAILAVSNSHADEIFKYTGTKPFVVSNVIDFKKFPSVTVKPNTPEFQMGFLGGMQTPVKGLDILLNAVAGINLAFKLHIGGTGILLKEYVDLAKRLNISDKTIFYDFVPHHEVPRFMEKLHFFISSSRSETFGIVIAEALACGLPVVATDSGGPADFITKDNGILVPASDPQKLKEAIVRMMKDYQKYNAEGIRKSVLDKFSEDKFTASVSAIYESVLTLPD